jgi:MFS family permease
MWMVAAQIAVVYILSTIPTPLYVVYRQAFHFSQLMLTVIYAVYTLGTIAAMFFLGRLADQIGRRPVVLASLAIAAVSVGLFLLANHTAWLFPARILSGLAIALASGAHYRRGRQSGISL